MITRTLLIVLFLGVSAKGIARIEKPVSLASGFRHTCVLEADGGVICWGDNSFGQIIVPSSVTNPTRIYSGTVHVCVSDDSGYKCWGGNYPEIKEVPLLPDFKSLALGSNHNCMIHGTQLKCWGEDAYIEVPSVKNPSRLSVGVWVSCVLDDSVVKCWGYDANMVGLLDVPQMKKPTHVAVGNLNICAVDEGKLICWGSYGKEMNANIPALVNPDFSSLCVGMKHACLKDDEGIKCWMGRKDTSKVTQVPPLKNPRALSCGGMHNCVIDDSGVKCWGLNDKKQTEVPN